MDLSLLGLQEKDLTVVLTPPWRAIFEQFLFEKAGRTGSRRTAIEYARLVDRFFGMVPDPTAAQAADIHRFAYGPGLSGRLPSPSTIAVRLAAVAGFYAFATRMGLLATDPGKDVRRPRPAPSMPRGLTGVEMSHLLAAIPDSPSGVRDRAVVLLAVFTGLRRGEILGLLGSDIASVEPFVIRPIVKGARVRILTVPAPAATAIRRYLESEGRTLATLGREERLFRISPSGYAANLQRYAKNAGLAHVSPHMLRHTAAKLRWQAGSSMDEVSMILGHADLATTARYLKAVNPQTDRGWAAVMKQLGGAAGDPPAALAIARLEQRCNKRDRKRVYRTRRRTFVATPGLPNER